MNVHLIRVTSGEQGTIGVLSAVGLELATLELPWVNNEPGISCIPNGSYRCECSISDKYGWCYCINDVPGRENIVIHHGEVAGNRKAGLKADTYGGVMVGMKIDGSRLVSSKVAFGCLHLFFQNKPIQLQVRSLFDGPDI